MQQTLEDVAKSPIVEFLTQLVYKYMNEVVYKEKSIKLLQGYTEFMKERNIKLEVSQKAFHSVLQHEFKARVYIMWSC